ncbi:MAG: cation acetate symporter, partial [Actinomycetota bacterium]|nr:cation acetate symporter [Actinomycetota bacterium]
AVLVALIVLVNVAAEGMRSVTLVQAFQYWLKLTALLTPLAVMLLVWHRNQGGNQTPLHARDWIEPLQGQHALYLTYSLILATFLGTMGLPHVAVRFYTNPDGRAARRTTVAVLAMLSVFYLLPPVYGVLGRVFAFDLVASGRTDSVVLELPGRLLAGAPGIALTALLGAGAFAAFLSTSSGLVMSIGGVLSQDLLSRRFDPITAFRLGATGGALATLVLALLSSGVAVAHAVELAFAVAASTFCPLLLLGIWWRGLTAVGAVAGLLVGGCLSATAVLMVMLGADPGGWFGAVLAQPALLTVPLAFVTMVGVSVLGREGSPAHVGQIMVRLHTPEYVDLDRGTYHPEQASGAPIRASRSAVRRATAAVRRSVT